THRHDGVVRHQILEMVERTGSDGREAERQVEVALQSGVGPRRGLNTSRNYVDADRCHLLTKQLTDLHPVRPSGGHDQLELQGLAVRSDADISVTSESGVIKQLIRLL